MIEKNIENNGQEISLQRGKLEGVVIKNVRQHEGTIAVLVKERKPHPKYRKIVTTNKKYLVHYEDKMKMGELPVGSPVLLIQIAPKSKRKFLKIEKVLTTKKVKQ